MPSSTVNICVLTLVLLSIQHICHGRLHRTKRGLVKDYFQPDSLVFSSDKFEKGEDGKYHLKKGAVHSEVKYSSPESEANILEDADAKKAEVEAVAGTSGDVRANENANDAPPKQEEKVIAASDSPTMTEEVKVIGEIRNSPKSEMEVLAEKANKASFIPVDAKPDSKDEVPLKTKLPPLSVEEKVAEKVSIGQVPDLYSRFAPVPGSFRVPVLIPIRQVSYGAVKVLPLPPADVLDRLPLPYEDDIMGEGAHESESEAVSQPISEEKKGVGYHLGNPLAIGVPLPALNFQSFLKDIKEANKQNSEKQSKVVDVLGKKFLMQANVMKYPTGDNSHMFLRFLSVKPLEESKSLVPKDDVAKKDLKELEMKKEAAAARDNMKKEESLVEFEMKKEESATEAEMKKEGLLKEQEVLKAAETKTKVNVETEVPKDVVLRNMGGPEIKIQEIDEKALGAAEDEAKIHDLAEHSLLEKSESQVVEMRTIRDESLTDEEEEKLMKEHVEVGRSDDLLRKELEMSNKKDVFQAEKKQKGKFVEENEKAKPKKKSGKKKKCKCEEVSDDDEE